MNKPFTKPLRKKELARILDVSPSTLQSYLNVRYYHLLKDLGYEKNSRILWPRVLNELVRILGFQDDH